MSSKLNGRTKGAIAGAALLVGVVVGNSWPIDTQPAEPQASSCVNIFAGRAGTLPCHRAPLTETDQRVQQGIGTTVTGCLLGGLAGGLPGMGWGCLGGLFSNIPWGG